VRLANATTRLAINTVDSHTLLSSLGTLGVFLVLFAETGLLIGFLLPRDVLLYTAGLLCTAILISEVRLSLVTVLPAAAGGALVGAQAGFLIRRSAGTALLDHPHRPRRRHGALRARPIPSVRIVMNPLDANVGVPVRAFTIWQMTGGLMWSIGVSLAGYLLGSRAPKVDPEMLPLAGGVVTLSLIPILLELGRAGRSVPRPEAERRAEEGP
jgi:membrane-associated protein